MVRRTIVFASSFLASFLLLSTSVAQARQEPVESRSVRETISLRSVLESISTGLSDLLRIPIGLFAHHGVTTDPNGQSLSMPQFDGGPKAPRAR